MSAIIVTGASSGIGRAVAEKFLTEGWDVGLVARRADALQAVAAPFTAAPFAAHVLPCDVTDPAAVDAAFASFTASRPLDVLFNNAGLFTPAAPIDEIAVDDWLAAVNVNLTGMFLCARAAFRHMRANGGRIINNGSVSAHTPREGSAPYTATKHGVTGLTKTLALDGRPFNIAASQIDIGNAETDLLRAIADAAVAAGQAEPPMIDVSLVADAVWHMANLPLHANTLFQTLMATQMPFVGRG